MVILINAPLDIGIFNSTQSLVLFLAKRHPAGSQETNSNTLCKHQDTSFNQSHMKLQPSTNNRLPCMVTQTIPG